MLSHPLPQNYDSQGFFAWGVVLNTDKEQDETVTLKAVFSRLMALPTLSYTSLVNSIPIVFVRTNMSPSNSPSSCNLESTSLATVHTAVDDASASSATTDTSPDETRTSPIRLIGGIHAVLGNLDPMPNVSIVADCLREIVEIHQPGGYEEPMDADVALQLLKDCLSIYIMSGVGDSYLLSQLNSAIAEIEYWHLKTVELAQRNTAYYEAYRNSVLRLRISLVRRSLVFYGGNR